MEWDQEKTFQTTCFSHRAALETTTKTIGGLHPSRNLMLILDQIYCEEVLLKKILVLARFDNKIP